jgi:hypothetical protein
MSIAEYHYAYESDFGKLKTQKRFKKKIKFKPVDLVRPDSHYIFNMEQMLCIFHAFYLTAKPFIGNRSTYGRLESYFQDSWNDGSPLFMGDYHETIKNINIHLRKLLLGLYGLDDLYKWRESMGFSGDMSAFIQEMELPCPPYYTGRHTMPIPAFHSFDECYDKVFAPKKKHNKKTSRMEETIERFYPVTRKGSIGKPFIRGKGVALTTYKPEELGYYFFRIDYAYDTCKCSCWSFFIRSKPGQTFVDFVIELSDVYGELCRSRSPYKLLKPVYEDEFREYCKHFYIK